MNEKNDFALVPRSSGALEKAEPGAKRILAGMVADTLALANRDSRAPSAPKFRIGVYELCEPDYLQLMAWAEQVRLTPLEVLRRLKEGLRRKGNETRIENGKFTKLNWDAGLLPVSDFQISYALELTELSFPPIESIDESGPEDLEGITAEEDCPQGYDYSARILRISAVDLPKLRRLDCTCIGLENLAVVLAPALERLDCGWNRLSTLDLCFCPKLKELICVGNRILDHLDLKPVPELVELDCRMNQIKELHLSPATKLKKLNCGDNFMEELVLPYLPVLVELVCCSNTYYGGTVLEKIDLKNTPNLRVLDCSYNALQNLDLSAVPGLRELDCDHNPLTKLDLSPVPMLERLDCSWTHLRQVDLSGVAKLKELSCSSTLLTEVDLSPVPLLESLYCSNQDYDSVWIKTLDIRPLHHIKEFDYYPKTHLIQRPEQHF
jgi:Leucine Rich Repeat (LRR) protein